MITLVHDWLNQRGGAEDVLETLVATYPDAPVYTSLYAPDLMPSFYRDWDIRPLWLDRMPGIHSHHQAYLPLYPLAWDGLHISGCERRCGAPAGEHLDLVAPQPDDALQIVGHTRVSVSTVR